MSKWWSEYLHLNSEVFDNLAPAKLVECALRENEQNKLSASGSLVITTGKFTGRAVDDKYVVFETYSERVIDWKNNVNKLDLEHFKNLKLAVLRSLNNQEDAVYVMNQSVCANESYAMEVRLITKKASSALFARNIFREQVKQYPLGAFTILHNPDCLVDYKNLGLKSPTAIVINFESREIIIIGTGYAGEIKKSIFSVLNTLLPEQNILPMHTGANVDKNGNSSLFFGLSGTGKTTLSTDEDILLIGDDEHGLSENSLFNFEGGCYAKTNGLKKEKEPDIFNASNHFTSLLENVVLDPITREPDFENTSLTENGRSTYSLKTLNSIAPSGTGPVPKNIFFLSADALGVLPAISKLNSDQAMFYFLSGYTAKLAGTEIGLKGIKTTFSHCFGAPFMMRKSHDYGNLLKDFLSKNPIDVWLVNTGWYGGIYGEGKRYPLLFTRQCIRAIQNGEAKNCQYDIDPIFELSIPRALKNVDSTFLNPEKLWPNQNAYRETALDLKKKFEENFNKL